MASAILSRAAGFRQTLRQLGYLDGILYAISRVLSIAFGDHVRVHKYYFVAQPVLTTPSLPPHRGRGFEIRWIGELDPLVRQFPRPEHAAPYRFNQGAVCIGASKGEALVGFLWMTLGPYQEDEVRCRYVPQPAGKSSWDFDVHVEPEYRHGIVFLKLWDEANRFLAERGIRWSLSRISAFNSGSILSHAKMGARRIGTATFLSVRTWQIAAATVRPYFHLSIRSSSIPTYALSPDRARSTEHGS